MIASSPPDDPILFPMTSARPSAPLGAPDSSTYLAPPSAPSSPTTRSSGSQTAISHLALPDPVLPSHPSLIRPTTIPNTPPRFKITPLPPAPVAETPGIAETLPRSLRDLHSFGGSTARPPLLPLMDGPTIRQGSFTREMRDFEQVLRAMPSVSSRGSLTVTPHVRVGQGVYDPIALITRHQTLHVELPAEAGPDGGMGDLQRDQGPPLGPEGGGLNAGAGGVDEIPVEWCWYCHDEGLRAGMTLRELGDDGRQWVCDSCAEKRAGG